MNRCIKLTFAVKRASDKLLQTLQSQAQENNLEGFGMASAPESVKIIVCGKGTDVDAFLDTVDELIVKHGGQDIAIDPFLKDKDYRGVFRIIF